MTRDWRAKALAPDKAWGCVKSGMSVFVHGAAATPTPLLEALTRRGDLEDVRLYHMHLEGNVSFAQPEFSGRFFSISLFTGASLRKPVNDGQAEFIPIFLSDIPSLFTSRKLPIDAALL